MPESGWSAPDLTPNGLHLVEVLLLANSASKPSAVDTTPGVSERSGECLEFCPKLTVQGLNAVAAGDGVTGVIGLLPANQHLTIGTPTSGP